MGGDAEAQGPGRGDAAAGLLEGTADPEPDEAIRRLYEEHLEAMVRLAHLITGSNLAAQDLVHDAFIKVSRRWNEIAVPAAYLRVTVVNECRSWLRHRVVVDRHDRSLIAGVEPEPELPDELGRVWQAMHTLPERQRVALVLRYWLDLPVSETAEAMGCPTGTVKSLVHRALHALEEELRDDAGA